MSPKKSVNLRSYEQLYVNTNQSNPQDTPILGFVADTEDITLYAGKETYFHFPMTNDTDPTVLNGLPLSASTLIFDGAIAGKIPYESDRIYKKVAGYEDFQYWGKSLPTNLQDGRWLCAWLSGDPTNLDTQPVWMDRWYIPYGTTSGDAIFENSGKYVIDQPSQMVFQPGVYYKYCRMGNDQNNVIVDRIGTGNTLRLHFDDWGTVVKDSSDFGNDGESFYHDNNSFFTQRVNVTDNPDDWAINFNGGKQCVTTRYSDTYVPKDKDFSIVTWVNNKNWKTGIGTGIIDQGFRGGWTIGYANKYGDPFTVFIDSTKDDDYNVNNSNIAWINESCKLLNSKSMSADINSFTDVAIDLDRYIWILDNNTKGESVVHQIDFNANKMSSITLDNTQSTFKYIIYTKDEDIVVFGTGKAKTINRQSLVVSDESSSVSINTSRGTATIRGVTYIIDPSKGFIDNKNVYHSKTELSGAIKTDDIVSCQIDYDGNIAVLHEDSVDYITQDYDLEYKPVNFPIKAGYKPTAMSFVTRHERGGVYDVIYVACKEQLATLVYKTDGSLINTINLSSYYVSPSLRTFSLYDWNRRFGIHNEIFARVCMGPIEDRDFTVPQTRYILRTSLDEVADGEWHQLALIREGKYLRLYLDCKLKHEINISGDASSKTILYPYKTQMIIGGTCGRAKDLGTEAEIKNSYFSGGIDDVRVYSRAITKDDLFYIYFNKFKYEDMVWNIRTTDRYYLENIQIFFKFKLPGSKSAHYTIRVSGVGLSQEARALVESAIRESLHKLAPLYTTNTQILWEDEIAEMRHK